MSTPPTIDDMVCGAEQLLPGRRKRAARTEQRRSIPPETIQDFLDAGLLRVLQPARYGGPELDYGRTQVKLCNVLGRACGSSAWFQSVIACHDWCLGMFAREAQDAVWGDDPDTLIASGFAFTTGRGRPVEGGYYVEGDWQFSHVNGAFVPHEFTVASDEFDGRPHPAAARPRRISTACRNRIAQQPVRRCEHDSAAGSHRRVGCSVPGATYTPSPITAPTTGI